MAELRPYEPTWRDRLANVLMGDGRSSARQQFVEGLLGSRGLGQTGMGLVDVTPFGVPLAVQESRQSFEQGNPVSGILGAMAVLPAARPAALAAKAATQEAAQGIRAYHGSPYGFEQFDLSKIGTGEGHQAYGHGLYFAEAEDVAKAYKGVQGMASANPMPNVASKHLQSYGDTPEARDMMRLIFPKATDAEIEAAINVAKNPPPGSMYEVNIKANPDDFLDWDKPISEQGARVQAVYEKYKSSKIGQIADKSNRGDISAGSGQWGQPTGKELHDLLSEGLINYGKPRPYLDVRRETTERLNKSGIPGIKYLDQGSRASGEGSRNYVVFDDKLIDIMRKYGLAGLLGGGTAAGALSQQEDMSQ